MRLDYLYYFRHLAEVRNYTKAANDLYIAQPTLSAAIKRMEKELGVKLFKRAKQTGVSHSIELTESGAMFYEHVAIALSHIDEGHQLIQEIKGEMDSSVRIGALYAMQSRLWSQAINTFRTQTPGTIKLSFVQGHSAELINLLRKGEIDVAFAARIEDGRHDLNHLLVWSQPLVLIVNKDNPLFKQKEVTLDQLIRHENKIITYAETSAAFPSLRSNLPLDALNLRYEFDDEMTVCAMVSSNANLVGLCFYSFLVKAYDDVQAILVADVPYDFHKVYLISRQGTHPKAVNDFIRFMGTHTFPNALDGITE